MLETDVSLHSHIMPTVDLSYPDHIARDLVGFSLRGQRASLKTTPIQSSAVTSNSQTRE